MLCEWPFFDSIHYIIIGFRRGTNQTKDCMLSFSTLCAHACIADDTNAPRTTSVVNVWYIRPLCTRVVCTFTVNWIENN